METFLVKADHAGRIHHIHEFILPKWTPFIATEIRVMVTTAAVAWVMVTAIKYLGPSSRSRRPSSSGGSSSSSSRSHGISVPHLMAQARPNGSPAVVPVLAPAGQTSPTAPSSGSVLSI